MSWQDDSAVALAREFGISPTRCVTPACKNTGWGSATGDGDPYYVAVFQCCGCGLYTALSRSTIVRRVRAMQKLRGE